MQITLYKNCKLNNAYKNVFSFRKAVGTGNQLIDDYLSSLTKITLTIDYSYVSRTGTIPLALENEDYVPYYSDIYEFNYCKVQDQLNSIERYCFITDIDYRDEVALVSYEEDIWHSYGKSMNITESFLSRNRLADKTDFYTKAIKTLPLKYRSNNKLEYNLTDTRTDAQKNYYLIVELQAYKGTNIGDVNERTTSVALYGRYTDGGKVYKFSLNEVQLLAQTLTSAQGSGKCLNVFSEALNTPKYFMNIANFYIIPDKVILTTYFDLTETDLNGYYFHYTPTLDWWNGTVENGFFFTNFNNSYTSYRNKRFSIHTEYITANKKMVSIGTFSNQIPCLYNGEQVTAEISVCFTEDKFSMYLSVADNFVEITDDFCYEVPFTSVNGEENSLLKLNRNIKNINGIASIIGSSIGIGMGVGSIQEYGSLINGLKYTKTGKLTTSAKKLKAISSLESARRRTTGEIAQEGIGITDDITGLISNNATLYSSTQLNKVNSYGIINAYYWLCYCTINSTTDFDNYQKECIDNTGYTVFEWVKDFNITGINHTTPNTAITSTMANTYKYNYVKFDTINAFGNFPRSVANILEEILMNGTKVWFTTAIE